VIAISASGNSKNVVNAIEEAQKHNVMTIGFTGFDGGRLGQMVNINIHVKSEIIEHVEDIHLMLEHIIVKTIKERSRLNAKVAPTMVPLSLKALGN
jgi:D-sedoheptulose 7-phosphate isomerase